jgi:hypothetical protein
MLLRSAAVLAAIFVAGSAWAQLPAKDWRSCGDGDKACQAFCDKNKPGDRGCTGDCYGRMNECKKTQYYPWGVDKKNLIGPLTTE